MNADRAAELLQIPERGLDLLQRFEEDEKVQKAIQAVQAGFKPPDVAKMYGLDYDEQAVEGEEVTEGDIFIYECTTKRCRQKGRVATSSSDPTTDPDDEEAIPPPSCPSCGQVMSFLMSVEDESDINHLKRTYLPKQRGLHDAMHGVDRSGGREIDEDD